MTFYDRKRTCFWIGLINDKRFFFDNIYLKLRFSNINFWLIN